jgi:hypothetical protein
MATTPVEKDPAVTTLPAVPAGDDLSTAQKIITMAKDYATGAIKGLTTDLAGTPVDLMNLLVSPATRALGIYSDKPVGGSAWFREKAGVAPEDSNLRETVGNLLTPGGAAHAMIVGATRLGRDTAKAQKIYEDLVAAGVKDSEARGRSFAQTGVYGGEVDGKFKTIISDEFAAVRVGNGLDYNYNPATGAATLVPQKSVVKLPDVLDHPELFQAYPELAKVKVTKEDTAGFKGSFTPSGHSNYPGVIRLKGGDPESVRSTILHEVQHVVQSLEKFTGGTNPAAEQKFSPEARQKIEKIISKMEGASSGFPIAKTPEEEALIGFVKRLNLDQEQGRIRYLNKAGEQEARFTQATKDMDIEELGAKVLKLIRTERTPQSHSTKPIPTK